MGLIRSGKTRLTPEDDKKLEIYMWPIIRDMIKTAIENQQSLIVEGCYIPFNWKNDFDNEYLEKIKYYCLIMTEYYINNKFDIIKKYSNVIENRLDDSFCTKTSMIEENNYNLRMCLRYNCNYILINDNYDFNIKL